VPDQLLNLLKLFLLLLLYLFFLRVLRAVWTEVNPPKPVEAPPKPKRDRAARRTSGTRKQGPLVLRLVAPPELKGRSFPLGEEVTVGRAAGCQVTIDDTYASQLHARVFLRDGQVFVEDLGSTNGTYLNRRKVAGPMLVSPGDRVQVGSTVMELA
jgi:pSer/pThr/pTyr-binding forkhead associated (FHA) protein